MKGCSLPGWWPQVPARSQGFPAPLWPRHSITGPVPSGHHQAGAASHVEHQRAQVPGAPGLSEKPRTKGFDVDVSSPWPLLRQPPQ